VCSALQVFVLVALSWWLPCCDYIPTPTVQAKFEFVILHYAEAVCYSVAGMLEKNKVSLLSQCMFFFSRKVK
jgi:hypothetical protein